MRVLIHTLFCAMLALGAACGFAQEDPLADLRAEIAALVASASVNSTTLRKGDGGPQYISASARLSGDEATYQLDYKSFLPPNTGRNRSELNDTCSGLGMSQPSDKGWYGNGFVDVVLADSTHSASISDACGQPKLVKDSGKVVAADFTWMLSTGSITLRFFIQVLRPELFMAVFARPNLPDAHLEISLRAYPGGFAGPFDRHVHTALQDLANAGPGTSELKIDPIKEQWMVLSDQYAGVTPRPMGPCAVAVDPAGIQSAGARIAGNYSVLPYYILAPGQTRALFIIREFSPISWQDAAAEVSATTDASLQAARDALGMLPQ